MNVKLTYTTHIDDVPRQAANILILDRIEENLEEEYAKIVDCLRYETNIELALKRIHELRIQLAKVDIRLGDVSSILDAYQKLKYTDSNNTENADNE